MSLLEKGRTKIQATSSITMFYGVAGSSKTTTACKLHGLNNTAFLNLEKGYHKGIEGVVAFEREDFPTLKDLYALLNELLVSKNHSFKAIVIDSLTALQYYFYAATMDGNQKYIEDQDYSKSHKKALEEAKKFVIFLQQFKSTGIEIIITAHSSINRLNDPRLPAPYDVHTVDALYKDLAQVFVKFSDNVGYFYFNTEKAGQDGKNKIKIKSDADRVALFEFKAFAPDCKNRLGLTDEVELDISGLNLKTAIMIAQENDNQNAEQLKSSINEYIKIVDKDTASAVIHALEKVKDDVAELKRIKVKLETIIKG